MEGVKYDFVMSDLRLARGIRQCGFHLFPPNEFRAGELLQALAENSNIGGNGRLGYIAPGSRLNQQMQLNRLESDSPAFEGERRCAA
jgi:hypothetical protein